MAFLVELTHMSQLHSLVNLYRHGICILLAILFVLSPLYFQANNGGAGLSLPYNIPAWTIACWLVVLGLVSVLRNNSIQLPKYWLFILLFPISLIISSVFSQINQATEWLFRLFYILGGISFLFALFQFKLKQSAIDFTLFIIIIAGGCQATLATMQIVWPDFFSTWFFFRNDHVPRGSFQQVNVLASFLATSIITTLYYLSRPRLIEKHFVEKALLIGVFSISFYVVIASGSRIGLLSLLIGIPLMLSARWVNLRKHKGVLVLLAILSLVSFLPASSGIEKTIDKSARLVEKSYSVSRVAMYTIGSEIIMDKPIVGHGIGSFLSVWNKKASTFVNRHPETVLPTYVGHPHNEFLLWAIEGGFLVVSGILVTMAIILIALYRCGFQRGAAYLAMLLPITLHTQVELPFYISSVHWFLWLSILFLVLRHRTEIVAVNLSVAMKRLIQVVSVFFSIFVTLFMINTARAELDIYNFTKGIKSDTPPLSIALNNLYTKNYAEQLAMRSMLYASIQNKDRKKVEIFEDWAMNYVKKSPELKMYEDLISASVFLRPGGKGCDAILAALAMYAHNKPLQKASEQCTKD